MSDQDCCSGVCRSHDATSRERQALESEIETYLTRLQQAHARIAFLEAEVRRLNMLLQGRSFERGTTLSEPIVFGD